jgi:hypothetical protein
MNAISPKFESAALNFADSYIRHQFGPQGRTISQEVWNLVDFLIWEAMPSHIERRDPEHEAWDYAFEVLDAIQENAEWSPDQQKGWEEHYSYQTARLLSEVREELVSRFRP